MSLRTYLIAAQWLRDIPLIRVVADTRRWRRVVYAFYAFMNRRQAIACVKINNGAIFQQDLRKLVLELHAFVRIELKAALFQQLIHTRVVIAYKVKLPRRLL